MHGTLRALREVVLGGVLACTVASGALPDAVAAPAKPARKVALVVDHRCVDRDDKLVPLDALREAKALKVVFGHQSVGFDVVNGLRSLAAAQPQRYGLTVQPRVEPGWFAHGTGVGEFFLGRNGDPLGKVDAFAAAVRGGFGERVDVAMMKLCYADLVERSDPEAIFAHWREGYEALEKEFPKVRFVWWTCPLTLPPRCSAQRTAVNARIRAYAKEHGAVLLDVADLECHEPDGTPCLHPDRTEKLCDGYARDQGGHLNAEGAERVARALWWMLARLAGWAGPS